MNIIHRPKKDKTGSIHIIEFESHEEWNKIVSDLWCLVSEMEDLRSYDLAERLADVVLRIEDYTKEKEYHRRQILTCVLFDGEFDMLGETMILINTQKQSDYQKMRRSNAVDLRTQYKTRNQKQYQ